MRATKENRHQNAALLLYQFNRLRQVQQRRYGGAPTTPEHKLLRRWQSERLARTHRDLLNDPRYRSATEFFLTELYGDRDFSRRDQDLERAYPLLVRTLPVHLVHTIALAVEINALSHELDAELLEVLVDEFGVRDELTPEAYAAAYRRCDNYPRRVRQIELIDILGRDLDKAVTKPFIYTLVRLVRGPMHLTGFGQLHDFIEAGFVAFRHMGGAQVFLERIVTRERRILDRIYAGHPRPLDLEAPD